MESNGQIACTFLQVDAQDELPLILVFVLRVGALMFEALT